MKRHVTITMDEWRNKYHGFVTPNEDIPLFLCDYFKSNAICSTLLVARLCGDTDCPYKNAGPDCDMQLMCDALALLKEREPVKPYLDHWYRWRCGNHCGTDLMGFEKYCPTCGTEVKWE